MNGLVAGRRFLIAFICLLFSSVANATTYTCYANADHTYYIFGEIYYRTFNPGCGCYVYVASGNLGVCNVSTPTPTLRCSISQARMETAGNVVRLDLTDANGFALERYFNSSSYLTCGSGYAIGRWRASWVAPFDVWGTDGSDYIDGTPLGDIISGFGGSMDALSGFEGNDTIYGCLSNGEFSDLNDSENYIYGGSGNDYLYGGGESDEIYGEGGMDHIMGGGGDDYIEGGSSNDEILGWRGEDFDHSCWYYGIFFCEDVLSDDDEIHGGSGSDDIIGCCGGDELYGDDGDDYVAGWDGGNEYIHGGNGNDSLSSGSGLSPNYLFGDGGNDILNGGPNADYLYGGSEEDHLYGYGGNDYIYGGSEDDEIYAGDGVDTVWGDDANCSNDILSGNDMIEGGRHLDVIYGCGGSDAIWGGEDTDYVFGGEGDDFLMGDIVSYTPGEWPYNCDMSYAGAVDYLYGNNGVDWIVGCGGNDNIYGGLGEFTPFFNEELYGGDFEATSGDNDYIDGGSDCAGCDCTGNGTYLNCKNIDGDPSWECGGC